MFRLKEMKIWLLCQTFLNCQFITNKFNIFQDIDCLGILPGTCLTPGKMQQLLEKIIPTYNSNDIKLVILFNPRISENKISMNNMNCCNIFGYTQHKMCTKIMMNLNQIPWNCFFYFYDQLSKRLNKPTVMIRSSLLGFGFNWTNGVRTIHRVIYAKVLSVLNIYIESLRNSSIESENHLVKQLRVMNCHLELIT